MQLHQTGYSLQLQNLRGANSETADKPAVYCISANGRIQYLSLALRCGKMFKQQGK
jgi:hypothetical protein